MTTIIKHQVKCAVCGHENEESVVTSTNRKGYMDLDTRPPEMERSTICYRVWECEECGYVAEHLSDPFPLPAAFLQSGQYLGFGGQVPICGLTAKFIKKARIACEMKDYYIAFSDYLGAAWAADDSRDDYWQKESRGLAVLAYEELTKQVATAENAMGADDYNLDGFLQTETGRLFIQILGHFSSPEERVDGIESLSLIVADILRRQGHFDIVIRDYSNSNYKNDFSNKIAGFQVEKAKQRDQGRYTIGDIEA